MPNAPLVSIYTDGACSGNPGAGGYAAVILMGKEKRELSGGFNLTTNSRMELMAAIEALRSLPQPSRVRLYSDSKYLVDSINRGWAQQWKSHQWRNANRRKMENIDLWDALLELLEIHQVEFRWVEGHGDNPYNERCDWLARRAAASPNLPPDTGYAVENQLSLF